ncbi:Molybdopterin molybdenumtransferase [hydrothermal vent metagenome]|uniref:Molybdopterin molybdenumtransferase n=1 Tax=hydrothermal vent metagenome TaxID=652676 RepID=A0A3B0TNZ0_9ZZZZ
MKTMLGYEEALKRVIEHCRPVGVETIELGAASGRVVAEPIIARTQQPPFDGSAMDGYAVIASEVKPGTALKLIGASQAGAGFDGQVISGTCVRIFTGAPLPKGADAVIMQEVTKAKGEMITFETEARLNQNVRPAGQDFANGEQLLASGTRLSPAALALIAAGNVPEISVYKQPTIGILATGDELVAPGQELKSGQIVASNGFALGALFAPYASEVIDLGAASDNETNLHAAMKAAIDGPSNIIISTGGASVGDHDLVLPGLKSLGLDVDFWKIAIRPGKPVIFATYEQKLWFALPGNPVSAYVVAISIVLPAIRAILGYKDPRGPIMRLPLATALPANGARRHFMRCSIETENEQTMARPIMQTDSSHLSSLAAANGLLVIKENTEEIKAGTIMPVIPLP